MGRCGGDAEFQKKCLGKMGDMSKGQGRTVLFVSHNLISIQQLCKNVIVLNKGVIGLIDTPINGINYYNALSDTKKDISQSAINNRKSRTSGSGDVFFYNVVYKDKNNLEKLSFYYNESISIFFHVKVHNNIPNLLFYYAIRSGSSEIITNKTHIISNNLLQKNSVCDFIIKIPAETLRPNQYQLYFGLANITRSLSYDVIDENVELPLLNIIPIEGINAHNSGGFFNIPTTLEIL